MFLIFTYTQLSVWFWFRHNILNTKYNVCQWVNCYFNVVRRKHSCRTIWLPIPPSFRYKFQNIYYLIYYQSQLVVIISCVFIYYTCFAYYCWEEKNKYTCISYFKSAMAKNTRNDLSSQHLIKDRDWATRTVTKTQVN